MNRIVKLGTPDGLTYSTIVCPFDEKVHYNPPDILSNYSLRQLSEDDAVFSREFTELSMVCRVLSLAMDPTMPLLDRVKFICIVSHYIDEHFTRRLGGIPKLDLNDLQTATINLRRQVRPKTRYEEDLTVALRTITEKQSDCLKFELLPKLKEVGVHIVRAVDFTPEESKRMTHYFKQNLRPALTPFLLDSTHPFPSLRSHEIYLYVTLFNPKNATKKVVIFRTPSQKRLIPIDESGLRFVRCEDLVLANLNVLCHSMAVLESHMFRVTRNTKIDITDESMDDLNDLFDFIIEEVHRRRQAPATRLEVMLNAPLEMVQTLVNRLYLDDDDVYRIDSPFLDLSSCMSLAFVPLPWLRQVVKDPVVPSQFKGLSNRLIADPGAIFGVLRKQDVLIEYPRDNFENSAVLFLHAAARDPRVQTIKSVLYRAGSNSPIVQALIRAAKNGKEVSVVIELKASFDEVQNTEYAHALRAAGCNVTYGMLGLKVHSKIMLVVREEDNGELCSYVNVSTGNFNPKTAKLYTDYSLFTCDREICTDVLDVFNMLTGYSESPEYRCLLVAPVNMIDSFVKLIREEAENARAGKPARIAAQVNGLSDKTITRELYIASQAGVRIDLLVRGSCRVRPGIVGLSENISVYSWVGHVLQHRRVFYFHAGGKGKYFVGSADWRTRNLCGRVEVVTPIKDAMIRKRLSKSFDLIEDSKYVWRMSPDGHYYKGFPTTKSPPVSVSIAPIDLSKTSKSGSGDSDLDEPETLRRFSSVLKSTSPIEAIIDTMAEGNGHCKNGLKRANSSVSPLGSLDSHGSEMVAIGKKGKKKRIVVNINGNLRSVDKVAVGVVALKLEDEQNYLDKTSVLMVARGPDDPWAFPKGGQNEEETLMEATERIAREKGGITSYDVLRKVGWIEVSSNKNKQMAVYTTMLNAKQLGMFSESARRRKWMTIREALEQCKNDNRHAFTQVALDRTVGVLRSGKEKAMSRAMETSSVSKSDEGSVVSVPSHSIRAPTEASLLQLLADRRGDN